MARGDAATSLAPGFRFHPTDEELVRYYLKRKVTNKPFRFDPISVVDVYKSEPWDLPGKSKLKSRDLEWYFFSMLDKKYNNGSKTNRATEKGYWKTTGKDRAILWGTRIVGMKKTLVYHRGRAPRGERTNWVMHEYRLADEELEKAGFAQDAYVLCRIFQKSGPGPKNGERYGAPLIEEEWDNDDEVAVLPGQELLVADEVIVPFDEYVETNDLDQNFDIGTTFENAVLPINFDYGGASNYVEHSGNFVDADLKPIVGGDISQYGFDLPDEQNLLALPGQEEMDSKSVNDAFVAQPSSNMGIADVNYTINPYFAATDDSHIGEAIFVPNNDILNPAVPGSMVESSDFDMVEDYLIFFDAEDENLTFDPSELMGSDNATNEEPLPKKDVNGENEEVSIMVPKPSQMQDNHDASCSKKKPMPIEFEPDTKPSYFKQATHLLGGVPAPPAFASEFPVKGAALQLHPGQSSSSIRVTAGMVRIESTTTGGNLLDWSFGKSRDVNVVFSFGLSQANSTDASLVPMGNLFLPGKAESLASLSWLFLMLFWVLIFSLSYKVGVYVCTK